MKKAAFTLVELSVVCAIIIVLMGLLFPALQVFQQNVRNNADRDLCIQVATAWNQLYVDNRRFPSPDLLGYHIGMFNVGTFADHPGGDKTFAMNRGALSVLNWWTIRDPRPSKDVEQFANWLVTGGVDPVSGREANITNYDLDSTIPKWPGDIYFERDYLQQRWGVFGSWVSRQVKSAPNPALFMATFTESARSVRAGFVNVAIDFDNDGNIKSPDPKEQGIVLNKRAIAWVYTDETMTKMIKSW